MNCILIPKILTRYIYPMAVEIKIGNNLVIYHPDNTPQNIKNKKCAKCNFILTPIDKGFLCSNLKCEIHYLRNTDEDVEHNFTFYLSTYTKRKELQERNNLDIHFKNKTLHEYMDLNITNRKKNRNGYDFITKEEYKNYGWVRLVKSCFEITERISAEYFKIATQLYHGKDYINILKISKKLVDMKSM